LSPPILELKWHPPQTHHCFSIPNPMTWPTPCHRFTVFQTVDDLLRVSSANLGFLSFFNQTASNLLRGGLKRGFLAFLDILHLDNVETKGLSTMPLTALCSGQKLHH